MRRVGLVGLALLVFAGCGAAAPPPPTMDTLGDASEYELKMVPDNQGRLMQAIRGRLVSMRWHRDMLTYNVERLAEQLAAYDDASPDMPPMEPVYGNVTLQRMVEQMAGLARNHHDTMIQFEQDHPELSPPYGGPIWEDQHQLWAIYWWKAFVYADLWFEARRRR